MSNESIATRVYKAALKRTALTAGELAQKIGLKSGRAISRPISQLVDQGLLVVQSGRYPKYTKATS